jgi:glutamine synthetase
MANGLEAGEPNSENLYSSSYAELTKRGLRSLPANLLDAIGELEQDDVLRAALGRTRDDEEYVDYYARVKRDEWFRYHEQVSAWEVREYLTRF